VPVPGASSAKVLMSGRESVARQRKVTSACPKAITQFTCTISKPSDPSKNAQSCEHVYSYALQPEIVVVLLRADLRGSLVGGIWILPQSALYIN